MQLDLDFVRAQFPAFSDSRLGRPFFENAGGSFMCAQAIDRLTRFYRERRVQPYGAFEASRLAGEEMDEARTRLAALVNLEADEISFGPSTSQNTYVLAQAFAELLQPGSAIVVTNQDHEANSGPWRRLAARGIEVREWKIDSETGHLDIAALKPLLDDKVRLVCFPHCSNVVGEINPVAKISALARAANALTCVDGVAYAPHGFPNIGALGCDIYLFSAYKTYGPHQGVMAVRRDVARMLPNQGHYFNAEALTKRLTPAGPDHAQVAGCAGMVDYVEALYRRHFDADAALLEQAGAVHELIAAHETALLQPLLDFIAGKKSARLLGPRDAGARAPTVALALKGSATGAAAALAARGVMAGGGGFYANRCLQALGIDPNLGVLRLSFVHYTSRQDVELLMAALDEIL